MTDALQIQARFLAGFTGMMIGAMNEAFGELTKELRRYAGSNLDKRLNEIETRAIRSIENAPLEIFSEGEQLLLVQQTRNTVAAIFKFARDEK